MFQITLLFLYLLAALGFGASRLPRFATAARLLAGFAFAAASVAVLLHGRTLYSDVFSGSGLTISSAVSLIGLQLGLIGMLSALEARLRGLSAGMLVLAALAAAATRTAAGDDATITMSWQMQTHVLTSMFAYGLLTVGAIVAVYTLIQERRLRSARLSAMSNLFAPLETMDRLLLAVTTAGFTVLLLSIISGFTFVEDLFAQHLVHKTTLSLITLLIYGVLLAGRRFAGWRGTRAAYLYLAGFASLCLAYFGSRYVLEELLGRSWG